DCVCLGDTASLLGLTALGALNGLGLGECGTAGLLTHTSKACLLGACLCLGDRGRLACLCLEDLGVATTLCLGLHLVPAGIRGLAHLGVQLTLLQGCLTDGDLLLLSKDGLVLVSLRERTCGCCLGAGGVGLGLDLGL